MSDNTDSDDTDSTDTDTADGDGDGQEYYYFSDPDSRWADARIHLSDECHVAVREVGPIRFVNADSVDDSTAEIEWCPECAPDRSPKRRVPKTGFYLSDGTREYYHLHLPGDVRLRLDGVREHDAGDFWELMLDGEVIGDVDPDELPTGTAKALKEGVGPPDTRRTHTVPGDD